VFIGFGALFVVEQDRDVWEIKVQRRTNGSGEPEKTYA